MKLPKSILLVVVLAVIFSGCSRKDRAAQQRLESEQQAASDAARANKAITNMNQSMFSRMNASTPGATPLSTQPAGTPAQP